MKTFKKVLSVVLCLAMLVCCFAGCGKKNENGLTDEQQAAVSALTGTTGGFGSRFKLSYPDDDIAYGKNLAFQWTGGKDGDTYTLKLEKKSGNTYTTVFEKSGIKEATYTHDKDLQDGEYRLFLSATEKDGTKKEATNAKGDGFVFTLRATPEGADINTGMDFTFDGSISEKVLNNYLKRTMTYVIFNDGEKQPYGQKLNIDFTNEALRAIFSVGAKYITRALSEWEPTATSANSYSSIKEWIDKAHATDPELIFEACIFETCGKNLDDIKIPAYVFEAFGNKVEDRNFDFKKMLFADGYGASMWDASLHAPDVTQLETQYYYYYLATTYIDLGFESLHMGQVKLTGRNDTNNAVWTKLIKMIRDYAKTNARRHYVLINGHSPVQGWIGTDGVSIGDFAAYPLRIKVPDGATDHAATETNPQKVVLGINYLNSIYTNNTSAKSPSGWTATKYPYLVEFDNYGTDQTGLDKARDIWGYDEISWFANQPKWYRHQYLKEVNDQVIGFNENGHVSMPGCRTAFNYAKKEQGIYYMNDSDYLEEGFDDEAAIKEVWKNIK